MKKFRKQDSEKYFEEKKPVRLVDTQEYMEMIRALLEDGQEVSMIVTGNSMRPFLKHGRDKICMKKTDRKLRKGDIVFYRRENGQYVMHRILKRGSKLYVAWRRSDCTGIGNPSGADFCQNHQSTGAGKMDRTGKFSVEIF